jgi:hypothetical protein
MLIGWCIRELRRGNAWDHLVTFADSSQGHNGTIYRATNWVDRGLTKPAPRWVDGDGRQVATKCGPVTRTRAQMEALGYVMTGRFSKRKFTMSLRPSPTLTNWPFRPSVPPAEGATVDKPARVAMLR